MNQSVQTTSAVQSRRLRVELSERSYDILIGQDLCRDFENLFASVLNESQHALIIADQNVAPLGKIIREQLDRAGRRTSQIDIPSGEKSKSLECLQSVWQQMLDERTDRGSAIIAIGGGVVGDLAGFAAATFARGLPLVQVPTTLLSQVDSSVGGKTGINLPEAKNIVGAFWQPRLVVIDTQTLASLAYREFVSGLAEVVKYGVILLPELFEFLEQNATAILRRDPLVIAYIVEQSCRAKAQVVQQDERETSGLRAILNYGHTFAHAIEATAGYGRWLHGEAVSIGMNSAAHLAQILGRIDSQWVARQANLLRQLDLPVALTQLDSELLWQAMQHDKKVVHSKLRFVLPRGSLGKVELVSGVSREQVFEALDCANRS